MTTARVRLSKVSHHILEQPAYADAFGGLLCGFFDVCKIDGGVDVSVRPDDAEILLSLAW